MIDIEIGYPFYPGLDGQPLQSGTVYYGVSGLNPVTNPVTVYWDAAGTQPAGQPIKVQNGRPVNNGAPARVFVSGDYSKLVSDVAGRQVVYEPNQSSRNLASLPFTQAGANAVARDAQSKMREVVSVDDFFLAGMADDTLALQRAVDAVGSNGIVRLPRDCNISSVAGVAALQVMHQNVTLKGKKGTRLNYRGAGVAIQLDTDDGGQWDAGSYNGRGQGFGLVGIDLYCANDGTAGQPLTALLNSITHKSYGTGTYGIRDWRGGSVVLRDASVFGFETGFWGIQSDLNTWRDVTLGFNHTAVFLGARSDQGLYQHVWSFGNDRVWRIEGARQVRVSHWTTDTDGSGTTWPVEVRNSSPAVNAKYTNTRETAGIVFEHPWCEQLGTFGQVSGGYDVDAIFSLNVGDTVQASAVVIESPVIVGYDRAAVGFPHFFYLVRCGNLVSVSVTEVSSARAVVPWSGIKAVFVVDASTPNVPRIFFSDADGLYGSRLIENYNAATCFVQFRTDGFQNTYKTNVLGGTGAVLLGGLGLQRRLVHNNAPDPLATAGDVTLNRGFTSGKSFGWIYDGASSIVLRAPTLGPNRGDADVTLTPETDHEEQQSVTALTADRTWILAAPPATAKGYRFRIVRGGGGASFNLNVVNLVAGGTLLKAMPSASWAEFMYDGANWTPRAAGLL